MIPAPVRFNQTTDPGQEIRQTVGSGERLPEIYAFCNGGSPGWYSMTALTEDGEFIAGHACSHPNFGPHDMGAIGNWKHDEYIKRYPAGYVVIWVPGNPKKDERIMRAYAKYESYGKDGSPWQREEGRTGEVSK